MADNIELNTGTGGATLAADDVGGIHYQRVKLVNGTLDASDAIPGEATNGLDVDVTRVQGNVTVVGTGTLAVQVDGAALTALQLIDDTVIADDAAFTPATTKVMMAGFEADEASIDSVDEGDGGAARMTLDRKVIVTPQPHTAGGLTIFRGLDVDETEDEVKATAGQVYGGWASNTHATSARYLKFYNATAASVVVGTTVPVMTILLPANQTIQLNCGGMGAVFGTAISVAATTGVLDTDIGAPGANEVLVNLLYK